VQDVSGSKTNDRLPGYRMPMLVNGLSKRKNVHLVGITLAVASRNTNAAEVVSIHT
jgi:hypothetical protein